MGAFATLVSWLSPVLQPLTDFRNNVTKLNTIHQDSVQTFGMLAGALVEPQTGPDAFTGELSDAFWNDVQTYLNTENALSGGGVGVAEGGVLDDAILACEECATDVTGAAEVAAGEIAGDAVLDEVTAVVDVAAVAEAGANPIADVAGIILTVIAGAAIIGTLITLAWAIYNAVQRWQQAMNNISNKPLPKLPPNPTPVPVPTPVIPPINQQQLTPQQQQLVQDLLKEFPDASQSDIENLVKLGYDEASIRAMLRAGFTRAQLAVVIARTQTAITNGKDQYGLTKDDLEKLFVNVANALNSPNSASRDEGKIGLLLIEHLTGFNKGFGPNNSIGEIDVETDKFIIEVKGATVKKGQLAQIQKLISNKTMNPTGKPVILYAPGYNANPAKDIINAGGYVVRSEQELLDLLKRLGGP